MGAQLLDLDIDVKLPITIVEADNSTISNGFNQTNQHPTLPQNGSTVKHEPQENGFIKDNNVHNINDDNTKLEDKIIETNNNNEQLELPKPIFALARNSIYRKRPASRRMKVEANERMSNARSSYFHYEEPKASELQDIVEYDMDKEDTEWLENFNEQLSVHLYHPLSLNNFEKIIDTLEKECYFEKLGPRPQKQDDTMPLLCAICNEKHDSMPNVILTCDMCDLNVHQDCYGVPYPPESGQKWLCKRCLQSPSKNVDCVLCPNKGGAFKQTDNNEWAHVICALWVPEVCFANVVFLEPIEHVDRIPVARWKLTCYICRQRQSGACIQCQAPNCYAAFHVTCGQQAGVYMKFNPTAGGSFALVDCLGEAFCDLHQPSKRRSKKLSTINDWREDVVGFNPPSSKKKQKLRQDKIKGIRELLIEKRNKAANLVAEPRITKAKLLEIGYLLRLRGRRKRNVKEVDSKRKEFIEQIEEYWLKKRRNRNGVPLLRRLQVSYNNNVKVREKVEDVDRDKESLIRMRYDLEKAIMLIDQVKKREITKKKLFELSREIVVKKFQLIDQELPPIMDE